MIDSDLDAFLAYAMQRPGASPVLTRWMRVMLSLLGIGLEQVLGHIMRERPSPETLWQWIAQTAGPCDPGEKARYIAMRQGLPPPEATQRRFDRIDAMAPVLDAVELARWERDGYAILRQAMTPAQTQAAADLVWHLAGASPQDPASWYAPRTQGIMIQHFQSPEQEAARRSPRIHKAFAQLWGTSDLWPTIDRLGFSAPVTAGAPFRATPLHWDCSLHWPIPYGMFGVLYLCDTRADQGALRLVPGFHHRLPSWLAGLGGADPRQVDLDDQAMPIVAGAGISSSVATTCPMGPAPTAPTGRVWCNISPCSRPGERISRSGAELSCATAGNRSPDGSGPRAVPDAHPKARAR